ncbi:thiamine phosphate synthase [Poseidonibacter ostreae]|jgi:thiamine-phosphate pyrophosphorylase|uniref:Thiamine phosphate synthase n=1 Tax=Poseidonibacter ostreae TaxID=2654171 RepID=A0A6L4WRC2_9BACT|nr:thiamine phosphate synthase [Poseidonibacter ostreae]KAB7885051.1 thiamine phosphate synthase [Poseidonibacter ostreae]KAB7887887.1 thiamine phosphate synthase [Poseidonibacter ostreae]KAB7891156.1 thiamine phosphate synthase [Poseidonibacter ostreae]MAC84838.1 thiamine phosphate synthase [Arcobacter sp.]|tara:strand:- start:1975 stop:2607 length:633 start_codon:yes stop_codon:yes gene_type:complete
MLSNFEEALGFKLEASNYLYVLCDYETLLKKNISLESFINLCKSKNVKLVQYRDKVSSIEIQKENLLFLKESLKVPILINDKIELIEYCNGLHLGQEDFALIHKDKKIAIKLIRKKIGKKLLGLSTHNEVEILEANELELDMIGLGAYKNTNTKDVSTVLGEKISYLAKISTHPVCAIGGVKIEDKIKNITFNVVGSGFYVTNGDIYGKN